MWIKSKEAQDTKKCPYMIRYASVMYCLGADCMMWDYRAEHEDCEDEAGNLYGRCGLPLSTV